MTVLAGDGRTFVLVVAFAASTLAGTWLGAVAAFVSGTVPIEPPRFPGEDLAAALAASLAVAAACAVARRTEGRLATLQLLFVASYAAVNFLSSLYLFAPPEVPCFAPPLGLEADTGSNAPLSARHNADTFPDCQASAFPLLSPAIAAGMFPTLLVAFLLCCAEIQRSVLLRSVGSVMGAVFVLAGLVLSLATAFV